MNTYTHEMTKAFWVNVYIFEKYSSRQVQRYMWFPPQLRWGEKSGGRGQTLAKVKLVDFFRAYNLS